ncbi:MAG: helix-turn-helix domain-containing protein [Syntrophomonas sp.]
MEHKNIKISEMPEIITAQHIADYLHISRRRVYELLSLAPEAGGIPSIVIGASKRAAKTDFEAWLEIRKNEPKVKKTVRRKK